MEQGGKARKVDDARLSSWNHDADPWAGRRRATQATVATENFIIEKGKEGKMGREKGWRRDGCWALAEDPEKENSRPPPPGLCVRHQREGGCC